MNEIYEIDPRLCFRSAKDLEEAFQCPITVTVNEFTTESAAKFRGMVALAVHTGQTVIPVVIDSYGGEVYSLLSMLDTISACPIPVATVATGKAMSCGAVLLTAGTPGLRYVAPTASIMIHEVASGMKGKVEEIKADVQESDRLNKLIFSLMAKNCKRNAEYFQEIIHEKNHADWYLTAEEALKHGVVDQIKVPSFKVAIKVEEIFG